MVSERIPPLAFVDEYGQANLDITRPGVATHFILTAIVAPGENVETTRKAVEAIRARYLETGTLRAKDLTKLLDRYRRVLAALNPIPFQFYAIVVDKREITDESGLRDGDSFYEFLSDLLYRKLFGAFPNLQVVADGSKRKDFMVRFARYLVEKHRDTLFDRPRVTFTDSAAEPLVQLADLLCGVLARAYDATGKGSELLDIVRRDHALLIDEWPVRYKPASGTGSILVGDPADDDIARYCVTRAERFLDENEDSADEEVRAQVLAIKKLLFEARFGDPRAYIPTSQLQKSLEAFGASRSKQWLRSTVIARLRDAGVLIASSPRGYKLPVSVSDIEDFVAVTDTVVHPMLNRVARARDAVRLLTKGRRDVLAGDRLALLRAAVEAIGDDVDLPDKR